MIYAVLIAKCRVLSMIFSLGEKIRFEIDGVCVCGGGGCGHRPEFSRGIWGHAPPELCESGSEVF